MCVWGGGGDVLELGRQHFISIFSQGWNHVPEALEGFSSFGLSFLGVRVDYSCQPEFNPVQISILIIAEGFLFFFPPRPERNCFVRKLVLGWVFRIFFSRGEAGFLDCPLPG